MRPARFPALLILSCLLFGTTLAGDALAATTITNTSPIEASDLLRQDSDLMATAIKMFGAFAIVLAVFGGFVLAVKKWGHLSPHSTATRELNVVEFRVLAHKTYLYVVEHQKNRFLISVGPNGTTLIAPPNAPSFAANLPFPAEELALDTPSSNS